MLRELIESRSQHDEYRRLFEQGLFSLEWYDQQDESSSPNGRTTRSSNNAERRGLQRLFELEQQAYETAFGPDPGRAKRYMNAYTPNEYSESFVESGTLRWYRGKRKDVVDNFLYEQWFEQRHTLFRTYAAFALYTCARAVVRLLTEYPRGEELLTSLGDYALPTRGTLLAAKESEWYDEPDLFMAYAWSEIPGLLPWAEVVMVNYGDVVRAMQAWHRAETTTFLPDDPVAVTSQDGVSEELRIELALADLSSGVRYGDNKSPTDSVAREYGIGQKKFRRIARERGLLKPVGGDRKERRK